MKQKTCCIIGSKGTIDEGMKAFIQKNLEDLIEHQAVSKFIVGNESNLDVYKRQVPSFVLMLIAAEDYFFSFSFRKNDL